MKTLGQDSDARRHCWKNPPVIENIIIISKARVENKGDMRGRRRRFSRKREPKETFHSNVTANVTFKSKRLQWKRYRERS